jgi:predicted RNA binding protein YcfA (HicA-like mRNA interferase family)
MKVRDIIKTIEKDGWVMLPRTGTSHRQFKHAIKPGRVTIAGHPGDDLSPKMRSSILKQAGLK